MLGSNTDIDKQANNLIQQARILGASDSEILQALTSKEGSNNDSRMIIGLLKLIASYTSSGGATDEQVASAVTKYLTDNPVQAYDDSEIKGEIGELKGDIVNLNDDINEKSEQLTLPSLYNGNVKISGITSNIYTGSFNIFDLLNTKDYDVTAFGVRFTKIGTNLKVVGTVPYNKSGYISITDGKEYTSSDDIRQAGGGYTLPQKSYYLKMFVKKDVGNLGVNIINNSGGDYGGANKGTPEKLIPYDSNWGQLYAYIAPNTIFDFECNLGLFIDDYNSLYRTSETSNVKIIATDGIYKLSEMTFGDTNAIITSTKLKVDKLREDYLPLKYHMKLAWFGDSISQLQELPHRVGNMIHAEIYDCSFAGAAMYGGASSDMYRGTNFFGLTSQIMSKDFSDLDLALQTQSNNGINVTEKIKNANTLKALNFNEIDGFVVMAGTNDLNNDYVTTDGDLTNFKNGMKTSLTRMMNAYPHLRIFVISNPYRGDFKTDRYGNSITDIVNAEREVCYDLNIPFYDLCHNSGINSYTESYFLLSDKLHQNEKGDILLAEKCSSWIMSN